MVSANAHKAATNFNKLTEANTMNPNFDRPAYTEKRIEQILDDCINGEHMGFIDHIDQGTYSDDETIQLMMLIGISYQFQGGEIHAEYAKSMTFGLIEHGHPLMLLVCKDTEIRNKRFLDCALTKFITNMANTYIISVIDKMIDEEIAEAVQNGE